MAKRRTQERTGPSRKEQKMTRQEREQARRFTIIVGVILGVAALILIVGLLLQFVITPGSAVAEVNSQAIATSDFWDRTKFEQYQASTRLVNLIQTEQQFDPTGEQGFFTGQIRQLQSQLADSEGLANEVLEQMIEEEVILQAAAEAGVSVSDEEIQTELDQIIAANNQGVTEAQATATAEALAAATPTPTLAPSPTPTTTVATTETVPTLEPQPTATVRVLTQAEIDEGKVTLFDNLAAESGLSSAEVEALYRRLLTVDLLRPKLVDAIGESMPTTGEQVRASHILISVAADASEADEQTALAEAISITNRLRDGEDFATLAEQFSDDPGSGAQGGDLGFFGRGQMVPEFEEPAFSLPIGEVSDPVRSPFGYHIILVTDKNDGDPDFNTWLLDKKAASEIVRNLTNSRLPSLPAINPNLLTYQAAPAPTAAPIITIEPEATAAP